MSCEIVVKNIMNFLEMQNITRFRIALNSDLNSKDSIALLCCLRNDQDSRTFGNQCTYSWHCSSFLCESLGFSTYQLLETSVEICVLPYPILKVKTINSAHSTQKGNGWGQSILSFIYMFSSRKFRLNNFVFTTWENVARPPGFPHHAKPVVGHLKDMEDKRCPPCLYHMIFEYVNQWIWENFSLVLVEHKEKNPWKFFFLLKTIVIWARFVVIMP